jgi:hypothetical protein
VTLRDFQGSLGKRRYPLGAPVEAVPLGPLARAIPRRVKLKKPHVWLALVAIALLVAIAFLLAVGGDHRSKDSQQAAGSVASAEVSTPDRHRAATPKRDRTLADRLRRGIGLARQRRGASPSPVAPAGSPSGAVASQATLDKDYIRSRIDDIIPLVKECYDEALERDATLAGNVVVSFRIAGEPDVGGVVESSEIVASATTIADGPLLECIRETMYAADFVAPPVGGAVDVIYPFELRSRP